jgi:hypothetical protein
MGILDGERNCNWCRKRYNIVSGYGKHNIYCSKKCEVEAGEHGKVDEKKRKEDMERSDANAKRAYDIVYSVSDFMVKKLYLREIVLTLFSLILLVAFPPAGIVGILIMGGLFYYRYNKKKKNKVNAEILDQYVNDIRKKYYSFNSISEVIEFGESQEFKTKHQEMFQIADQLGRFDELNNTMKTLAQEMEIKHNSNPQNMPPAETKTQSVADELKKFKELMDAGVLTQEEFDKKKKELIG